MLDERWEYACFLEENTYVIPLQQSSLEKKSGFRRILRILAKGFLEKCEELDLDREQSIRYCRGFLQTWVSGEYPENFEIPDDCGTLLTDLHKAKEHSLMYHAETLQKNSMKDRAKLPERMEKLARDIRRFEEAPYQNAWNVNHNDFNCIYYDQIIADAFNRKSLRSQRLVMKKNETFGISCDEKLRKIALAVVCMYLQDLDEFDRPVRGAYLPLIQAEVGNWLHERVKKKDRQSNTACIALAIERACWGKPSNPLFDKKKMVNISKVRVDPDWLEMYDVKLMDAGVPIPEGYTALDDAFFC